MFDRSVQRVVVRPEFRQVHRLKDILDIPRPAAEAHVGTKRTGFASDLYEYDDVRGSHKFHGTKVDYNIRRSRLPESRQNTIRVDLDVVVSQDFQVSHGGDDHTTVDIPN